MAGPMRCELAFLLFNFEISGSSSSSASSTGSLTSSSSTASTQPTSAPPRSAISRPQADGMPPSPPIQYNRHYCVVDGHIFARVALASLASETAVRAHGGPRATRRQPAVWEIDSDELREGLGSLQQLSEGLARRAVDPAAVGIVVRGVLGKDVVDAWRGNVQAKWVSRNQRVGQVRVRCDVCKAVIVEQGCIGVCRVRECGLVVCDECIEGLGVVQ